MNRPRNRQQRPPRAQDSRPPGSAPRSNGNTNVPSIQQVIPGAAVSIVLKADQPTGREVQGVVQDLLTRGNHPRGIKVRLQDGRVGRVQRITPSSTTTPRTSPEMESAMAALQSRKPRDEQESQQSEPPPRSLADFLPEEFDSDVAEPLPGRRNVNFTTATVKCPICGKFEGDEAAVSHHIDEHLT